VENGGLLLVAGCWFVGAWSPVAIVYDEAIPAMPSSLRRTITTVVVLGVVTAVNWAAWREWKGSILRLRYAVRADETSSVEARLSGFPYRRGTSDVSVRPVTVRTSAIAAEVMARAKGSSAAGDRHAVGVAALMMRKDAIAIENLAQAAGMAPTEAGYRNDLAAALYMRARREGDTHGLIDALAAADAAIRIDTHCAEARYNRALIIEAMPLRLHAVAAWELYLQEDADSQWTSNARRHLTALRTPNALAAWSKLVPELDHCELSAVALRAAVFAYPEEVRRRAETVLLAGWAASELAGDASSDRWLATARSVAANLAERNGDVLLRDSVNAIDGGSPERRAALARAHRSFNLARRLSGARHISEALEAFEGCAAVFRREHSPMAFVAEYYAACCLEDQNDPRTGDALAHLLSVVPEQYASLRAQLLWELGTTNSRAGRPIEALAFYAQALAIFDRLGEQDSATRMRNSIAAVDATLGRHAEAWRLRSKAFGALSDAGEAEAVQAALELAGRTEALEEHWDAAASLFSLATEEWLRINLRVHVSALLWSALTEQRLRRPEAALERIAAARRSAIKIADPALRATALDDLTFAEGSIRRDADPVRAAALLERYTNASVRRGRTTFLAEAYLEHARARRALGNRAEAEALYRRALDAVEERRRTATAVVLADTYFATADAAAHELADLELSEAQFGDALAVLDRSRPRLHRLTSADAGPSPPLSTGAKLPDDVVAVTYLLLPERAFIFTLDRASGLGVKKAPRTGAAIEADILRLDRAIRRGDEPDARSLASRLHDELIAPVVDRIRRAQTVFFIPDHGMESVPFAALRDRNGRFLAEDHLVLLSASVEDLVRPSPPAKRAGRDSRHEVLVIGDPHFDRQTFPALDVLPAADTEARRIGRLYPKATVLLGDDATVAAVSQALRSAWIVHFGGHALVAPGDPMRSFLLLTPANGDGGVLYAKDIVAAATPADVVVLAGCRTASAGGARSNVATLSHAFLTAGAGAVFGTLWDVDDHIASTFSQRLHRQLAAGRDPAEAMQTVQRELLRDAPLMAWSSFTLWSSRTGKAGIREVRPSTSKTARGGSE
jgi:CHAT domain-containing protein